jgi:uncharacterized protein YabN with tetrapyrrole methylase and pyrophosphatase domain
MITIIGLGISAGEHLTLEGLKALKSADVIFAPKGALPPALLGLAADFRDTSELYHLPDTEKRLAAAVLAAEPGRSVAVCTVGHPLLFDKPAAFLKEECRRRGVACRALPGVSAVDAVLCELGYAADQDGFQARQALHVPGSKLDPSLPLFVFRCNALAARADLRRRFIAALRKPYPPGHLASFVESAHVPKRPSAVRTFPLKDLEKELASAPAEATLFVPPLKKKTRS